MSLEYLIGVLVMFLPVWLVLYFYRKDLHEEMLTMSLLIGMVAPLWAPMFSDYWSPEYLFSLKLGLIQFGGVEDFLYGFFIGGIASVVYEEIASKRFIKARNKKHTWRWLMLPFGLLALFSFNVFFHVFKINSVYAAIGMFILLACFLLWYRRDFLLDSLVSGLLLGVITFVGYLIFLLIFPTIILDWWHLSNVSGYLLVGIPIEELLWAFTLGMVGGPFYEFLTGKVFRRR